jgi:hypothetical protein
MGVDRTDPAQVTMLLLKIDKATAAEIRRRAAHRDASLAEVVEDAIRATMAKRKAKATAPAKVDWSDRDKMAALLLKIDQGAVANARAERAGAPRRPHSEVIEEAIQATLHPFFC